MAPSIPLFLAASSGPRTIQKFTLGAWDPTVTIRQLGASIMGPTVEDAACRGFCYDRRSRSRHLDWDIPRLYRGLCRKRRQVDLHQVSLRAGV